MCKNLKDFDALYRHPTTDNFCPKSQIISSTAKNSIDQNMQNWKNILLYKVIFVFTLVSHFNEEEEYIFLLGKIMCERKWPVKYLESVTEVRNILQQSE